MLPTADTSRRENDVANPSADFHIVPRDGTSVALEVRQQAAENLESFHLAGKLAPIEGWDGGTLEGYLDILGLNDRRIKMNRSAQVRL